jgi:ribosome biogenesis GTPase / thiamine phosphate phosphatase
MSFTNLRRYGLDGDVEKAAASHAGMYPARISEQHRALYKAIAENGEIQATVSGNLVHASHGSEGFPAVGDWVMVDRPDDTDGHAVIQHILPRKSAFIRKAAGRSNSTQIIAANVDVVLICTPLNADFNLRRLERYLSVAWDSGATPVILLTKADLCTDLPARLGELESITLGADVLVSSCTDPDGEAALRGYVERGRTYAFVGSSGVGKSTLINHLIGQDVMATQEIREGDDKGRHTTAHRQLILLPGGGIVIDTPGIREIHPVTGSLARAFEDIELLGAECKFKDCTHTSEPGCAVTSAVSEGRLLINRLENYRKIERDIAYEGLNSRQVEGKKIARMFGGKAEMKRAMKSAKNKNRRRG